MISLKRKCNTGKALDMTDQEDEFDDFGEPDLALSDRHLMKVKMKKRSQAVSGTRSIT